VTIVNRTALVPYSAAQMFLLIDDIEAYPQFLPWCSGTQVLSRLPEEVIATIRIAKGPLHKEFTTRNRLMPDSRIELTLQQGPFKRFEGAWTFAQLGEDGCRVGLVLDFEFSSRILTMTVGPVFNEIASTMVNAFCARARAVHQ